MDNYLTKAESAESVAGAFFRQATAKRVDTDAVIYNSITNAHPGVPITTVPEWNCSLRAYAASGHATIEAAQSTGDQKFWPDSLRWTVFLPPSKRLDGGEGIVADEVFFESYFYKWQNQTFLVYFADGRDGQEPWPTVRNQYILGDKGAARTLVETAGRWNSVLHDEIWVFNQGYWHKDTTLYRAIQKSHWEDVILDKSLKEDLVDTVQRFFDSRDEYDKLRVPWKRGVIFYGPPGNGKTISIKATMHTLYNRTPPIPTLYVKSLVGFAPPEYSIESIFRKARQEAPCYLVFEDLDSLVTDQVRSFFLNAVDGLSENEGILMIGSTNHLDRLDPGIAKRPSRFDRKYLFPDPDFGQRVKYCHYWQKKLSDNKEIGFPDEICEATAKITDAFSFAYIQEAFVSALLEIAREKDKDGKKEVDDLKEVQDRWELLELDGVKPDLKEKDLDDYILWRKLKHQIEMLRKELAKERTSNLPSPSTSQKSETQQRLLSPFGQPLAENDHSTPSSDGALPGNDEVISLIEAYFEHIYALPWYAFLHQRSVMQRCREGKIEDCLKLAICAVTAQRLQLEPYCRESSAIWAQKAEDILLQYMESPSTSRLQALILIVRYRVEVGHFSRAFMLAALAGRSAVALRLNYERPELRFLAQEVRRRLMWSCFALDGNFSVGLREFETSPPEHVFLQLPCPETAFEEDAPVATAPLRATSFDKPERMGTYAACIRLQAIRTDIMRLTRRLASSFVPPDELMHIVRRFEDELQHLYRSLAESDRYNPKIFSYCARPARILMVHECWHQAYTDLYRIFLTGYREAAPPSAMEGVPREEILRRRTLCLNHALSIVQIFTAFSEQCTVQTIDFDTAICAYHSARIILFNAQTDVVTQSLSMPAALEKAAFCQSIMNRYFRDSPVVEPMKRELEMLIARNSSENIANSAVQVPSEEVLEGHLSRLADEARTRQRLAIHSLIGRADFVDDSNEVTSPAPPGEYPSSTVNAGERPLRQRLIRSNPNVKVAPQIFRTHGSLIGVTQSPQPKQTDQLIEPMINEPTNYAQEDQNQWLDGMRLAFNPWMGWPETLETYGFTQDLDDDYF
ncbi:hypothetical protein H2200_006628 [Cladophialophora chaetospira]|uniref:Xylanolytic transcriptional activator regulatory domain-containing protein n=1 Tax=Cladophialophora chaetospira TaxID=386627 RepID=A0AA38X8P4_9EURO|nr:hypothetical protein H2200_006628 [Cladophialophora chaetospira]